MSMRDGILQDQDLVKVKNIKSNMYKSKIDYKEKECLNLAMFVDSLSDSQKVFLKTLFKIATGTEDPLFVDKNDRQNLLQVLNVKPLPSEIQKLTDDASSAKERKEIQQAIEQIRTRLTEIEKIDVKAKKHYQNPESLAGIIVSAGIIMGPRSPSGTPAGLACVRTLSFDIPDLCKAQEDYFDNGVRKPLMSILAQIQQNNAQPAIEDIQYVLDVMSKKYNQFDNQLSEVIKAKKKECEKELGSLDLKPEEKEALIKALEEKDIALIQKFKQKHKLPKLFGTYFQLLENQKATREHYEGSVKELMRVYNKIKSQPLTERYNQLLDLTHELDPQKIKEMRAELVVLEKILTESGEREIMYSKYLEDVITSNAKKHNAQIIVHLQQGAIPAMGSSEGLCYGYSYLFGDHFNALDPNASLEDMKQALSGKKQFDLRFDNNHLGISLEAYMQWDAQFDLPLKDTFYVQERQKSKTEEVQTSTDDNKTTIQPSFFMTNRIKRQLFCNDIISFSANHPCTYMLSLQPEDSEKSGHAIGFARNEKGIWLHDSNLGLIFFDSKNPNYETDFKNFFSNHITTYYPNLQAQFSISNIGVTHQLKKGIDAIIAVVADLKKLNEAVNGEHLDKYDENNKAIEELENAFKTIFDLKRLEMPNQKELDTLQGKIEKLKQILQVPEALRTKDNVSELIQKCTESMAKLEEQERRIQRMPVIKENPSVATLMNMHLANASRFIMSVTNKFVKSVKAKCRVKSTIDDHHEGSGTKEEKPKEIRRGLLVEYEKEKHGPVSSPVSPVSPVSSEPSPIILGHKKSKH